MSLEQFFFLEPENFTPESRLEMRYGHEGSPAQMMVITFKVPESAREQVTVLCDSLRLLVNEVEWRLLGGKR